jgi:hypothetical protein
VPALAAAGVAAIAAAALIVLPDGGKEQIAGPAGTSQSVAQSNQFASTQAGPTNEDLLIRSGDKVQVSGQIIAVPGKAAVFCPPIPRFAIGYYPPGSAPAPSCPADVAVTLKGVDLDRIHPKTIKGVRTGSATLVGIWGDDRSIDVREQTAGSTGPVAKPVTEPSLPCAAPAGGWVSKPNNLDSAAVRSFLDAHAGQIFGPVLHYPKGRSQGAPVVVRIGVAHGDLAALRSAFEKVYDGNLCVAPVLLSLGDNDRIGHAVGQLVPRKELGLYGTTGTSEDGGPAIVQMVAYTEAVKAALSPIGLDLLQVDPAVKPVS